MDRIGGWNVPSTGAANAIVVAEKDAAANKQHVIASLDISFNAAPAAPVHWEIIDGATSPGTVVAQGWASGARTVHFPEGLCIAPGHAVAALLGAAGGSVVGALNLHGVTR